MSKRETVALAIDAFLKAAAPFGDVYRNRDRPTRIAPGGQLIWRDGDPGEPEVTLGILTYTYTHRFPLEAAVSVEDTETRAERLDLFLTELGEAVAANRTLGGLCEWFDVEAPAVDDAQEAGTGPILWADLALIAVYTTTTPLT